MKLPMTGVVLREADIQRTICDFLRAEQWRVFQFEQEWLDRKKKLLGEEGMSDVLAIRYIPYVSHAVLTTHGNNQTPWVIGESGISQVLWIECKRIDKRGRLTKPTPKQAEWKLLEQKRGALVWTLGQDCEATFEGFKALYQASGLRRR